MCHSRPLAAWNVSSSTPCADRSERVGGVDPRPERGAVADRLGAQELEHRPRRPRVGRAVDGRRTSSSASSASWAQLRSCVPSANRYTCAEHGWRRDPAPWTDWRTSTPMSCEGASDRRELGVGAGQHGDAAGCARATGRAARWFAPTASASACSSSWAVIATATPSAAPRSQDRQAGRCAQHVDAGVDDLWRAAVVDRQAHDLDAREAALDVDQQRRVAAVEAVDRLRRVADEVQVVAAGPRAGRSAGAGAG